MRKKFRGAEAVRGVLNYSDRIAVTKWRRGFCANELVNSSVFGMHWMCNLARYCIGRVIVIKSER